MADRIEVDPDSLRAMADRHDHAAARIREWGKIPHDWLARFRSENGTIAEPVRAALTDYFDRRHRRAERQADHHERTRDALLESANILEARDLEFGRDIGDRGRDFDYSSTGGPVPATTTPAGGWVPGSIGPATNTPTRTSPESARGNPDNREDTDPVLAGAVPPTVPHPLNGSDAQVDDGAERFSGVGDSTRTEDILIGEDDSSGGWTPPSVGDPAEVATPLPMAVIPPGLAGGPSSPPAGGVILGAESPTGAAALPAFIGPARMADGDQRPSPAATAAPDTHDLAAARSLLAAVLYAVGSTASTVQWSAGVLRNPAGAALFLTTNEGRGWLPPGLYLPRKVSTPWIRDDRVGIRVSEQDSWERCADPARILVEFADIWGVHANARLTALVTSGRIDPRLRETIASVAVEERVAPGGDMDLRVPSPYTVDRLGLAGSTEALHQAAVVPRVARSAQGLELAADAHRRVRRAGATPLAAAAVEQLRDRILATLESGQSPPSSWWSGLRQADSALASLIAAHRAGTASHRTGLVAGDESAVRSLVFERRCTELVLLLDGEPGYRKLRDQLYAHEQIVKHPAFIDTLAVSVVPPGSDRTPAAAGLSVAGKARADSDVPVEPLAAGFDIRSG
ncbi:hypothetical protein HLB23_06285 [Nocardia uniformis]|uniref:Uncharacterized protein n=1 Tax=Nocardia uniformis TaxID=53432 RepID=A0A849C965_9NOCA|nr:type VII secretion target [Nocardia uniformis]NNH69481.1 hypothetical protein [Nocardia uniformis]